MYTDAPAASSPILDALKDANRVLLLTHVSPDGDAIGSLLAVWHVLHDMGKTPIALASSALPDVVATLPGIEHVQVYQRGDVFPEADLVWLVDAATLERTGPVFEDHEATLREHPLIIVDHHVTNTGPGMINLIQSSAASCADVLLRLFQAMECPITPAVATCLLLGLTTDTQSFQTTSTKAQSFESAAVLIHHGADHHDVVKQIFYQTPYETLKLMGLVYSEMQRDGDIVWVRITRQMMEQTGAEDGAYDDILHLLQRVQSVRICVLFKEREDGNVKLSLRSTPDFNMAEIARRWGGGGHAQAAGATLHMDLPTAEREILPEIRAVCNAS
ncbi:MAG: bifunctional oligoribonuclease/PAP phosphatase NrnA [Chloroflexaceae bacterium]|nr:bifunctional oligoribonuclease/PAP phosphatase NrnA [Chloroflexaceae bacterium]